MAETKVISVTKNKCPIRFIHYLATPVITTVNSDGSDTMPGTAIQFHVIAEVSATLFASFILDCPFYGVSDQFIYYDRLHLDEHSSFKQYMVDFMFIDGNNSYLFIKQTHFQTTENHFLSVDTVTDYWEEVPYRIEIGRDSHFSTLCLPTKS